MLVEGGGTVTTGAPKPEPRKKLAPGVSRLQEYIAEPSDTPAAAAPSTPSSYSALPGSTAEAISAAYGQGDPIIQPGSTAEALGMAYAVSRGETPASAAITTEPDTATQEAEAKTYRARKTKEMSWDDYLGLGERGRSAVDFNTMLVQARQKDLKSEYEPNVKQQEIYDIAVERMFGKEGVSETFAPETLALLNDIHFEQTDAKRFDDLDDFLGLSSALTARDIDNIGMLKGPDPVLGSGSNQMDLSLGGLAAPAPMPNATAAEVSTVLAAGTSQLQDALTRGNQVLENWKLISAGDRNESIGYYGGTQNRIASPDIRMTGEGLTGGIPTGEYFDMAFNTLSDATNPPETLGLIKKDLRDGALGEKGIQQFLDYADTKSKYSVDNNVGLGSDTATQYRTPDEFRQVLGLGGGGPDGADRG